MLEYLMACIPTLFNPRLEKNWSFRPAAQSRSSGGLPSKSPGAKNQMEYKIKYVS